MRSVSTAVPSAAMRWNFTSKPGPALAAAQQLDDALAAARWSGSPTFCHFDVVGEQGVRGVEVLVLHREEEPLDDRLVVERGRRRKSGRSWPQRSPRGAVAG